jgi:hypothetical protein
MLQALHAVSPDVSDGHPGLLGVLAGDLGPTWDLSQTCTVIIRGSGTLMVPTWFKGMDVP